MELQVSSPKLGGLSPPDCASDPEEKEVSDEDDDDRNHKHRRQKTRSQSLETDSVDPVSTRPYRKRNKLFENGHPFRENDLTCKFDRRRPGLASFPRGHMDMNQRIRPNQPFSGDSGPGRGRGRDNSSWNQRDSRFNSIDIASQMVQPGPSWSPFGLIPAMPNGGLDALHPIGLQGALRPPMNSALNMSIPRQRCRDFEERGFCLRGDMCPMEHGVNRIVVEDVQSLSQFNLPVVPSAPLLATPAGAGPLSTGFTPSTALINSKGIHGKSSKPGMTDDVLGLNDAYIGSSNASAADLYDPDQPLWNNNGPQASGALSGVHSPKIEETEPLLNDNISDRHYGRLRDIAENELPIRSTGSQGTGLSVWGRIGSSTSRMDAKDNIDLPQSDCLENETKEEQEAFLSSQGTSRQVKQTSTGNNGYKVSDSSFKSQADVMHNSKKPTQKALRTLFVNGIPQKSNKREALLSHFRKFGEVIDIYIPLNSERAFVQFSRREEAEAALKAPDAVMGNRFIKLWWANRDSIPDDGINSGSVMAVTSCGPTASVFSAKPIANKEKDNLQPIAQKSNFVLGTDVPSVNSPKPATINGPKIQPPSQKKLETIEQMKEELRKKQEMLEQKRNDFRRQLDKLQRQSSSVKGDVPTEQAAKRKKVGMAADLAKAPNSSEPGASASTASLVVTDKNKSIENVASHSPKSNNTMRLQEHMSSTQQSRPPAPVGYPFMVNRYKLDNRPTAFKVIPPLPSGFADVEVLKEHFFQYGDLLSVEIEDVEDDDTRPEALSNCSVLINYSTRGAAERAYVNGKSWQGNDLQFTWITSRNSSNDPSDRETSSSAPKENSQVDVQTEEEKLSRNISQEVSASGNGESGNLGESFVEHEELPEDLEHSASPTSSTKESPKGDTC